MQTLQRKQSPLTKWLVPVHFTQKALWCNCGRSCTVVEPPRTFFVTSLSWNSYGHHTQLTWQLQQPRHKKQSQWPQVQPASPCLPTGQSKSLPTVRWLLQSSISKSSHCTRWLRMYRWVILRQQQLRSGMSTQLETHLFQGIHQWCIISNTRLGDVNNLDEQL